MHSLRRLLITLFFSALSLSAVALTNQDIIKMHQAGLDEATILLTIKPDTANFDTSPEALITLKTSGVPEAVIQKMLAPASTTAASGSSADEPSPAASSQDFHSIAPPFITPVVGQTYYTRFSFHEEGGEYITTNYARGAVVPINTAVKLISMSGSKMVLLRSDNGQSIKVINKQKYTRKSIPEIASLLLADEETALAKLPEDLANAIRAGEMRLGMTKELVLMARGYPPAHETASTDSDRWVYWSSRFVKRTIVFTDGRLSEGRGLR